LWIVLWFDASERKTQVDDKGSLSMPKRTMSHAIALAAAGIAAAMLLTFAMVTATSRPATANPTIAKDTGQPCAKCHTAPPALNDYGQKYKASQKK
jgi:hypothetical protein